MLRSAIISVLSFCLMFPAFASPLQKHEELFSLYSDICYHKESGDVLGLRVGVLWLGPYEPFVFVQHGEGDMGQARLAKLDRKGARISFTITEDGKTHRFSGTISETEIVGRFPDISVEPGRNRTEHRLKRVYDRQLGFASCR